MLVTTMTTTNMIDKHSAFCTKQHAQSRMLFLGLIHDAHLAANPRNVSDPSASLCCTILRQVYLVKHIISHTYDYVW